jgi:hypothetical protein
VQIAIQAPLTVRSGETFPVMIEMQAAQGVRQLVFSIVYKKSILELVGSSAGAIARRGGPSVQFEEVSDGTVLVRVDVEGSVLAGAGSVAVLEFQARKRGVSPLAIHGVTYVGAGRQNPANTPTAYEGSITVE